MVASMSLNINNFKRMKFNTRGNENINIKILSLLYKFGYKWTVTNNLKMLRNIREGKVRIIYILTHEDGSIGYTDTPSTFNSAKFHKEIDLTDILRTDKNGN